jgi:Flp pilus assembly protein TadG
MQTFKKSLRRLVSREDGVVGVEMVILFPLLVLIVVGLVEFGHLWYVRQALTNASREGARAAVVYATIPGSDPPTIITAEKRKQLATDAVTNYMTVTKFHDSWETNVILPDTPLTGDKLTVTVNDTSPSGGLLLLHKLLPVFQNIKLGAETTMRLE